MAAWLRFDLHPTGMADLLPLGPDSEDWLLMARDLAAGNRGAMEAQRYPLVPWVVVGLADLFSASRLSALAWLALSAGTLAPALLVLLGRHYLPGWLPVAAATWMVAAPSQVLGSLSTTAYAFFSASFLAVALALLGPGRRWTPWLSLAAAALAAGTAAQGMLCVFALIPAALLRRRWTEAGAAALGSAAGAGLAHWIHPGAHSPMGWMLGETWRYISGNIAEETAATGLGYGEAWLAWHHDGFSQPAGLTLLLFALATIGMLLGIARPRHDGERRDSLAMVVALIPLGVLTAAMGSAHHSLHLTPLLVLTALLGAVRLLPAIAHPLGAGVLTFGMGAMGVWGLPDLQHDLNHQASANRALQDLAHEIDALGGPDPLVLSLFPEGDPGRTNDPVVAAAWALAKGATRLDPTRAVGSDLREAESARVASRTVLLVTSGSASPWTWGHLHIAPRPEDARQVRLHRDWTVSVTPVQLARLQEANPLDWDHAARDLAPYSESGLR